MKKSQKRLRTLLPGLVLALMSNVSLAELRVHTTLANLRSGPAVQNKVTALAHSGESLKVMAYQADYVQVTLPNGKSGWIHAPTQGWKKPDILAALGQKPVALVAASVKSVPMASPSQRDAVPAPAPLAPSPFAASSEPSSFNLTLADIGLRQGHFFEGAYGVHSKDFYFPLPQGATLKQGSMRVYFRASPLLNAAASLRLDINGKPSRLLSLENREQASFVDIPLDQDAMQRDALRLTVKAVLSNGENRCLDERRLALHFVQILPQTAVTIALDPATNLAAAWTSLPSQVTVGIPQTNSPSAAAALLQTAVWLRGMGRQVSFAPFPQAADVMVGSEDELSRRYPGALAQGSGKDGALAFTHDIVGKPLILVTDRLLARPLASQPLPWARLLRGDQYRIGPAVSPTHNREVVDLIAAGLGETQYVSRNIEWSIDLAAPLTPADKRLQRLLLNIVAAPQPEDGQQLLQVFLNGILQEVRPLDRDGKPHTLRFDLNTSSQRAGINNLRIAVQRTDDQGNCEGDLSAFPVQLLPGTRIELGDANVKPVSFNDLRAHFAKGMDVYLTPDSQANLPRELQMAASVFSSLGLSITEGRVHFLKTGEAFAPKHPFVLIGRGVTPEKVAVHLDRGRIQVLDGNNQPLLDLDRLPGIGLAQMVSQGGEQGLSLLAPAEGSPPPFEKLHLDRDNVAFITEQGVALTLDSREPAISKLEYPDYDGWLDWFAQHRFWMIALGWMLIGATLVGLYRKVRGHGKN
ncbi:MAG: cellulose biosynthesis cyclic di-GMP-binding regulatory protein BcsB [Thiobacillus sp.]